MMFYPTLRKLTPTLSSQRRSEFFSKVLPAAIQSRPTGGGGVSEFQLTATTTCLNIDCIKKDFSDYCEVGLAKDGSSIVRARDNFVQEHGRILAHTVMPLLPSDSTPVTLLELSHAAKWAEVGLQKFGPLRAFLSCYPQHVSIVQLSAQFGGVVQIEGVVRRQTVVAPQPTNSETLVFWKLVLPNIYGNKQRVFPMEELCARLPPPYNTTRYIQKTVSHFGDLLGLKVNGCTVVKVS
eukprot:PhM_4_TR9570/c0_g2_i1/m.94158